MEEYIKNMLEQIRCKKAHAMIEKEIRSHMEEQMEANVACGMNIETAEKLAVKDMGDPVENGIALDAVHRPEMAWDIVIVMAMIGIISVFLQRDMKFLVFTLLGFLLMLTVYWLDYSVIAKYAKWIASGLLLFLLVCCGRFGVMYQGAYVGIRFVFGSVISVHAVMLLYVPLYAAILYHYRGMGRNGIVKAMIWMLLPVVLLIELPSLSLAAVLCFSMGMVFSFAVWNGWFQVSKKKTLMIFWTMTIVLPIGAAIVGMKGWIDSYAIIRIRNFFEAGEVSWISEHLQQMIGNSTWIGGSQEGVSAYLEGFQSEYVLAYLMSTYGILAGVMAACLLIAMVIKIFRVAFVQKNQLGMVMGYGCGMVLVSNMILNLLINFGIFPPTRTFLPFFSRGGNCLFVSYILLGIVMSIYRYKNILPAHSSYSICKD